MYCSVVFIWICSRPFILNFLFFYIQYVPCCIRSSAGCEWAWGLARPVICSCTSDFIFRDCSSVSSRKISPFGYFLQGKAKKI
jgi:hypothetical protein